MTEPTRIFTVGPADPNAGLRAKVYAGISALLGIVGLLATFKIVSADQAVSIKDFAESAMNLAGSFGLGFAAIKTNRQVHNGTFEAAPTPPSTPVLDAFQAVDAIKTHVDDVVDQAQAKVTEGVAAIQGAAALLPGGTFVTNAVMAGPVGDLLRAVSAVDGKDA